MKKILSLALSLLTVSSVSFAQEAGFQFVLVATHQGADVIFYNEDVSNRDFTLGEMNCKTRLETKKDPIYPDQTLGSLILDCMHGDFPIQTSVTCSLLDPAAQNHFEFGKADAKFSFDLLCKAKPK
ncbi:hypothetical protein [Bdellovibrio sp. HCB337]|uniref:hypothetical protein n=1 Tax=Bdellovibrio sp. HCB337 TaxID=3394358 RepID=UPI0039A48CC3